jgi:phosphinothricin acetyltransferase
MLRLVNAELDVAAITEIYNYYVINTVVTFEEIPVTNEIMKTRIQEVTEKFPWYVFEENGEVCPANWEKGKDGMNATAEGVANYLAHH